MNKVKTFFRNIRHNSIVKHLQIEPQSSVLDSSCQDGTFLKVLLKSNPSLIIHGIDMDSNEIDMAKSTIKNAYFKVSKNTDIRFEDKKFDVVISSLTLHHMDDPKKTLTEIGRVLKSDGVFYLIDIVGRTHLSKKILSWIQCPEPYHFEKFYNKDEVVKIINGAGFEVKNIKDLTIFPVVSIVMPISIFKLSIKPQTVPGNSHTSQF